MNAPESPNDFPNQKSLSITKSRVDQGSKEIFFRMIIPVLDSVDSPA